jgi:anti-sigma-K factor RskA
MRVRIMHDDHVGENAELYALGLLDTPEAAAVDAHVRNCTACARRLGEAEETLLELERRVRPAQPPASLDWRMRFGRSAPNMRVWAAVAAAFVIGLLSSAMLFRNAPAPHDAATVAMVESHFNHAQFVGGGPPAKAIYARDRAWLYVIVHAKRSYDVYAVSGSQARRIGSTQSYALTSEAFITNPGVLDAIQLRDGSTVIETARVR